MYIARNTGTAHEHVEVFVGDSVLGHVFASEMEHHAEGGVLYEVKTITTILCTEAPPEVLVRGIVGIRNLLGTHVGDGIRGLHVGVATHVLATDGSVAARSLAAGQILHYDGIVEHTGMNQQLLLSGAQVFVTGGVVPWVTLRQFCIAFEELAPSLIVGHKYGL